jgi:hypothetical protein
VRGLGGPQAQRVDDVIAVAGDGHVVGHGQDVVRIDPLVRQAPGAAGVGDDAPAEAYFVDALGARYLPGVTVLQPLIGSLGLGAAMISWRKMP